MALTHEQVQEQRRRLHASMGIDADWVAARALDTDHDALRARVAVLEREIVLASSRLGRMDSESLESAAERVWQERCAAQRIPTNLQEALRVANERAASLQAEVEIECQARVAAANEREEQRAIADFQQHRAEEAEKALAEAKLDVGQVTAERDSLLYSNKLLRERRDELQAEVEKLSARVACLEYKRREAEEDADQLQAEVERLEELYALARKDAEEANTAMGLWQRQQKQASDEVKHLTQALSESERKRAELAQASIKVLKATGFVE